MNKQDLIAACEAQGATHRQVDGRLVINAPHGLDLRSLTEIPERVTLKAGGGLFLERLTELPDNVTLTAGGELFLERLTEVAPGVTITAGKAIFLNKLTKLAANVKLTAGGSIYLDRLTKLAPGVSITAGREIYVDRLTELPQRVSITAGGWLHLHRLAELPERVTLTAGGALCLDAVTKLAPGASLTAGGTLFLGSLTKLAANVTLTAGGTLFVPELAGKQVINGHRCTLGHADQISHRELSSAHAVGDGITVQRVALLRGAWDEHPIRYLARQGTYAAHGVTAQDALRDLADKVRAANFDLDAWAAEAVAADRVTREDYRLATGACRSGVEDWLADRLDAHVDAVTVDQAIELCRGGYGAGRFIAAIERAAKKGAAPAISF